MLINQSQNELSKSIKEEAQKLGFNAVGIAAIPGSERIGLRTKALENWLEAGYQADMHWMEAPRRQNINTLLKNGKSVIAVGLNYYVDIKRNKKKFINRKIWMEQGLSQNNRKTFKNSW